MAALPYMQLYVADYLADTAHLTTIEHGAYLLLIMNYWQRGKSLKNCNARLASVARMSNEAWEKHKEVLKEFFEVTENEWRHRRIEADLEAVNAKVNQAKAAGKASADKRLLNKSNGRSTVVKQRSLNDSTNDKIRLDKIIDNKEDTSVSSFCPELKNLAPEPKPKIPPVISLILNTGAEYPVTQSKIDEWQELYPAVDVMQTLKTAKAWCINNPKKRKTKTGILRFLNNWLAKEQDKPRITTQPNGLAINEILQVQIKKLYCEILEPLAHSLPLNAWTSEDGQNLQAIIEKSAEYQDPETWRDFFTRIATLRKLTGLQKLPDGKIFKVSLSYIVREKSFADICNGVWDND